MSTGDFDRLRAAMMAARADATGRTPNQVEQDIHRARLANLQDDPPELTETLGEYVARMIRVHGTTYAEAAAERYQGATKREASAKAAARMAIANAMRRPGTA